MMNASKAEIFPLQNAYSRNCLIIGCWAKEVYGYRKKVVEIRIIRNPRTNEIIPLLVSKNTCLSLKSSQIFKKRYLHLKKTGCWRRNVPNEDLVAEDKPRLVSSIVGPIVGNGTEEAVQEAQMVGFIFSFSLRDFFLKLSPIPDGILSSLTILGLGIRLSLVLDEVGTGRFKTGCRRRNVIKEDFIFIVPISVSVFTSLKSGSWWAPVQGPGLQGELHNGFTMTAKISIDDDAWHYMVLPIGHTLGLVTWKRIPLTSQALIGSLQWLTRVVFLRVLRFPPTHLNITKDWKELKRE